MTPPPTTQTLSSSSYREPSDVLKRLFLPPKDPSLTLSSDYGWLAIAQEPPLPSIDLLAKKEEKLAGLRFDPYLLAPSRMDYASSLVMQHISTGTKQTIELPTNSEGIRYIRFHPSKSYFVFASKVRSVPRFELYVCELNDDIDDDDGRWSIRELPLGQYDDDDDDDDDDDVGEESGNGGNDGSGRRRKMNFVLGCAYQFVGGDSDDLLVRVVPDAWPDDPPIEPTSVGPSMQEVSRGARKAPGRTYQDLLKNEYDAAKLRHFLTVEVLRVDATSSRPASVPQCAGGRLVRDLQSSPCGRFALAQMTAEFSYSVPIGRFGKDVEIWDLESNGEGDGGVVVGVATLPVDDEIPLSYDACSRHPRKFHFHPCLDHAVVYAVATDGGIGLNERFDGGEERDAVYCRVLDAGTMALGDPTKLIGLEWRYSDLDYTESGLGIVDEYRWSDRMEKKWILDDATGTKRLLWERSWEDRYTAPGRPLMRRGSRGQFFVVQPTETSMYLQGAGASPLGDRPFLDLLDFSMEKARTTRLWRSAAPLDGELDPSKEVNGVAPTEREDIYESLVCMLKDNDSIMISRESKTTPQNYFLLKLSDLGKKKSELQITDFKHPQPDLLGITKELVQYKRDDGVQLTANLYLPTDYDGTARPTLFWAYPREFKDPEAAGQVKGSKHRFVSAHWASPIHWAAKGWVIMDDFSLPVIGEGDAQPNDTFIEQLVSGATAAVNFVTARGVCDPRRCAVGGHSYGSFMTAHLLSHTSLFAAGIGRSGAFNRTLTPMSFQSEERSIWEAPDTYITMSPLMHVKKYSLQERVGKMLLIHGAADENDGTFPMQSERYFAALKAFGIESRLVILPHERHSYRARESILHMAWEQEEWLKILEHDDETGGMGAADGITG